MSNVFDGYIDTFNVAKERTSELEENTNFSNCNAKRKKWKRISKNHGITAKVVTCKNGTQEGE